MAMVAALQARDASMTPPLTGLLLSTGFFLSPEVVPEQYRSSYRSYNQLPHAPIVPHSSLHFFKSELFAKEVKREINTS